MNETDANMLRLAVTAHFGNVYQNTLRWLDGFVKGAEEEGNLYDLARHMGRLLRALAAKKSPMSPRLAKFIFRCAAVCAELTKNTNQHKLHLDEFICSGVVPREDMIDILNDAILGRNRGIVPAISCNPSVDDAIGPEVIADMRWTDFKWRLDGALAREEDRGFTFADYGWGQTSFRLIRRYMFGSEETLKEATPEICETVFAALCDTVTCDGNVWNRNQRMLGGLTEGPAAADLFDFCMVAMHTRATRGLEVTAGRLRTVTMTRVLAAWFMDVTVQPEAARTFCWDLFRHARCPLGAVLDRPKEWAHALQDICPSLPTIAVLLLDHGAQEGREEDAARAVEALHAACPDKLPEDFEATPIDPLFMDIQ